MIGLSTIQMMMVAFALLAGLGVTSLLVDRDVKRKQAVAGRLAKATRAELRTRKVALRSLLRTDGPRPRVTALDWLAELPGFDLRRRQEYPPLWWLALLIGLGLGRLTVALAAPLIGVLGWLAVPLVAVLTIRLATAWVRAKRDTQLLLQFPDALGMLVRSVRAGLPLSDAIRVVARESQQPTAAQFQVIVNDLAIGLPIAQSLTRLASRSALAEYHFFATALTLQSQTGGRLSETLDGLGDMIRKRVAAKNRALALASEARTSAIILAALPLLSAGALSLLNWPYVSVMFVAPEGQRLLAIAGGCLGFGVALMNVIIRWSVS